MTRNQAYSLAVRAMNEKLARTKHVPTRKKLTRALDFLGWDPAFKAQSAGFSDAGREHLLQEIAQYQGKVSL